LLKASVILSEISISDSSSNEFMSLTPQALNFYFSNKQE
jgi:hypothetical protein